MEVMEERVASCGTSSVPIQSHDLSGMTVESTQNDLQEFGPVLPNSIDLAQPLNLMPVQTGEAFLKRITVAWLRDSIKCTTYRRAFNSLGHLSNHHNFHPIKLRFSHKVIQRWTLGLKGREWATTRKARPASSPCQQGEAQDDTRHHFPYFEPTILDFTSRSYEHPPRAALLAGLIACAYGGIHAIS
jgi:hypothetical protein